MCGVRIRFGHPASGEPAGSGSLSNTSSAAPPRRPLRSAAATAASSTTPPRAVLTRIAPGFIDASRDASIRLRVAGTSGTCSVSTSACASSASSVRGSTPSSAQRGSAAGTCDVEADDAHAQRPAEPRRSAGRCRRSRRRPASCRRSRDRSTARPAATCRRRPRRSTRYAPRSSSIAVPITYSATASALAPVAGMTAMPRDSHSATSMLSRPTPSRPTTREPRRVGEQVRVHLRAVAHDQRVGLGEPGLELVATVDEVLVVDRLVMPRRARRRRPRP